MAQKPYYLTDINKTFNIKEEAFKYIRKWPWFIVTSFVFIVAAYFYLKYSPVVYETTGKIKVLDESSKGMELPKDLSSLFEGTKVNLENEIEVLKSYRLLYKVVEELELDIRYYEEGRIKRMELWHPPFKVNYLDSLSAEKLKGSTYNLMVQRHRITITDVNGKEWYYDKDEGNDHMPFDLQIINSDFYRRHEGKTFSIGFSSKVNLAKGLSNSIGVSQVGKMSEILSLKLLGENKDRSEAIINETIRQFNLDGIHDRQLVSQRTIDFVDDRFQFLTEELDSIEKDKQSYKQNNSLSDIKLDTEYTLVDKVNTGREVIVHETQLELASLLIETLEQPGDGNLLPANIGIDNIGINTLISEYNNLILDRKKMRVSAGENNPYVQNMTTKLEELKGNIFTSVKAYEKQAEKALSRIEKDNRRTKGMFSQIPKKEKFLRAIERQQTIKETLYILLLEKREEAAINLAVTSPSVKVVDYALTSDLPISPKTRNIYLMALFFGILLPLAAMYVIFLLDTKVHSKIDIEHLTDNAAPVLGEIPLIRGQQLVRGYNDKSVLAESFRILKTNLNHTFEKRTDRQSKIIYVTSTIKGEGKTFSALNLALTYASYHRNVLLVGADFRNPKLHTSLGVERKEIPGLSDYLDDPSIYIDSLIQTFDIKGLSMDVLFSGPIPPNPSSLVMNGNYETFIDSVKKKYDIIIVDTAPTILVADTLLISKYADATLYVVRSEFTEKRLLPFSKELIEENKLPHVGYLINGVNSKQSYGYNYNYGYNYGYNDEEPSKPSWKSKVFKKS